MGVSAPGPGRHWLELLPGDGDSPACRTLSVDRQRGLQRPETLSHRNTAMWTGYGDSGPHAVSDEGDGV